jgi:hypothetical protein
MLRKREEEEEAMSTVGSAAAPAQLDVGEAFGYVFRSKNWFGKIALGALCLLFFWLLLIPLFILLGYSLESARTIARGGRELPPWNDIGKKLGEGFLLAVVLFIWGLPGELLGVGGSSTGTGSNFAYHPGSLAGLGYLYSLLLGLLTPAIWSQYLEGGFGNAFDFRAIFRRAGQQPGMTVTVWLLAIVAAIIGGLGVILIGIGLLFTLPYAFFVISNLYGQFARLTEGAAAAPSG